MEITSQSTLLVGTTIAAEGDGKVWQITVLEEGTMVVREELEFVGGLSVGFMQETPATWALSNC